MNLFPAVWLAATMPHTQPDSCCSYFCHHDTAYLLTSWWQSLSVYRLSVSLSLSVTICLSLLSVSQLAPHWASVSGFVIKKSHQSQQRADWMPQPCHAPLRHDALSFICCQHYQRVDSTPPLPSSPSLLSHYSTRLTANPIECPITAPKSFPFRFHCKTNVMSVVSQLISPPLHTPPPSSHLPWLFTFPHCESVLV